MQTGSGRVPDACGMDLNLIARNGVFPFARARSAGLTAADLRRMVRSGQCHRLHHGWFSTRVPDDDTDRHLLRVAALVEEYAGHAVASHDSGLLRLGLPTFRADLSRVHLTLMDPTAKRHRKSDLVVHSAPAAPWRIGTPARTVHPALAMAQVGLRDPRALLVPADAAVRRGVVTHEELDRAVTTFRGRSGVGRARAALPHIERRHESPGETVTAYVLRLLGHSMKPQFRVPGTERFTARQEGYRTDFRIEGTRVLVEFDGKQKYDRQRDLWDEKRREDRIRSLGWEVVRLTWADLRDPARVAELVEAALRRSLRHGPPPP